MPRAEDVYTWLLRDEAPRASPGPAGRVKYTVGGHTFTVSYQLRFMPDDRLEIEVDGVGHRADTIDVICRIRCFEVVANASLGSGHVLTDAQTGKVQYRELTTAPWDLNQVLRAPAYELTDVQCDELVTSASATIPLNLKKTKIRSPYDHRAGEA